MNFQNWERVGVGAGVMRVRAMRNQRAGASESDEVGVMKTLTASPSLDV